MTPTTKTSKEQCFNSARLRWWIYLQHVTRALGYKLTYIIFVFCHIDASIYLIVSQLWGTQIGFFLTELIVCVDAEK